MDLIESQLHGRPVGGQQDLRVQSRRPPVQHPAGGTSLRQAPSVRLGHPARPGRGRHRREGAPLVARVDHLEAVDHNLGAYIILKANPGSFLAWYL